MQKLKLIYFKIMESILPIIGMDPMKYKLRKYRLHGAKIGDGVRAFSPITSAESYLITVGDNVTVASGVRFITHDNSAIKIYDDATDFVGPITIGDNVFIGAYSTLLPGITIAENCIIGAGSVVCKSCTEPGMIIAGNPARPIGTVDRMKEKYELHKFDFRGKKRETEIMNHKDRWQKK